MSILNAIFQAIVQGLTEFLPVSSSGHLALIQHFTNVSAEEGSLLSVVLHLGTLLAVFIAFRKTIWSLILEFFRMIGDIFTGKFHWKEMNEYRRMILLLVVATLPMLVILPVYKLYKPIIDQPNLIFLGICFLATSTILYLSDRAVKGTKTGATMRWRDAAAIGVTQCIATLPGISRSGSTVSTSLLCGLSRKFAVQFSFILGIPAILGAGVLEISDAVKNTAVIDILPLLLGFAAAAIVGFFAIKMVSWLIKTSKFRIFSYYTLAVGAITIGIGIYQAIVG